MQTGMNTFSSKLPCDAAMDTATSLPMTCTATMVSASHCVGLTLPGMMEEPGSLAGMISSPMPQPASQTCAFSWSYGVIFSAKVS